MQRRKLGLHRSSARPARGSIEVIDSRYAWIRLAAAVALSTLGGVGLWSIVVALPTVQAEFGTARSDASLPYTLTTLGFAVGGVLLGRLADRLGVMWVVMIGAVALAAGYLLAAQAFRPQMLGRGGALGTRVCWEWRTPPAPRCEGPQAGSLTSSMPRRSWGADVVGPTRLGSSQATSGASSVA